MFSVYLLNVQTKLFNFATAATATAVREFLASIKCGAICVRLVWVKFVVRKYSSKKMRLDQPNDDDILPRN